jgi:hypothetical protein
MQIGREDRLHTRHQQLNGQICCNPAPLVRLLSQTAFATEKINGKLIITGISISLLTCMLMVDYTFSSFLIISKVEAPL